MALLDEWFSEDELLKELQGKTGKGTKRTLRKWRQQRVGPPWAKLGNNVVYPIGDFKVWLRTQVQQPVRSHKRALA